MTTETGAYSRPPATFMIGVFQDVEAFGTKNNMTEIFI
jgi:hypothetical protein